MYVYVLRVCLYGSRVWMGVWRHRVERHVSTAREAVSFFFLRRSMERIAASFFFSSLSVSLSFLSRLCPRGPVLTREELQASGQNSGRGTSTRERSKKEDDEKKTQIPSKIEMKKEEVFARWQSSWQPCYAVLPPGSSSSSSSSSQQSDVLTHLKIQ